MRGAFTTSLSLVWSLLLTPTSALLAPGGASGAPATSVATRQKQVLVLYSLGRDSRLAKISDHEIPRLIEAGLKQTVDYYSEFMDIGRVSNPDYQAAFYDFLRLKYEGHHFDVIIAMSTSVLEFVKGHRSDLFAEIPVIFFSPGPLGGRPSESTGVISEPDFLGTIELARQLQPDLEQAIVISGAEQDAGLGWTHEMVRRQLANLSSAFRVTYWIGLAAVDLEARLRALPPHSIVLYVSVNRDRTGEFFNPLTYVARVTALSTVPTYSWVDSTIGKGVVGGSMKSQVAEATALAQLALRVLTGERADTIEPLVLNLNVPQVDWRQLRRWGIGEWQIPTMTTVLFREAGAWERYRPYILGTVLIVFAQSCLIGLLILHRLRRRQAETQSAVSQQKLRASYERIRDLAGRLLMAQEAERARIARDLHDDVGQQLALLAIDLELIAGVGTVDDDGATETLMAETLARARGIATSVHNLSHTLHPEKLHLLGLVASFRTLRREFSRPDLAVTFAYHDMPDDLPREITLCLYRIGQEALLNSVKHSRASHVSIQLAGNGSEVVLTIEDDGLGFSLDAVSRKGLGLISMGERAEAVGGSLRISTSPGAGTRLEVFVPSDNHLLTDALPGGLGHHAAPRLA